MNRECDPLRLPTTLNPRSFQNWRPGVLSALTCKDRNLTPRLISRTSAMIHSNMKRPIPFQESHGLIREWIPQSEGLLIPDLGHGFPVMAPTVVAEGMARFLAA